MGGGSWTTMSFNSSMSSRGVDVDNLSARSVNQFYKEHYLHQN